MKIKGHISRLLGTETADQPPPEAAGESVSQLRLPTLDERASLYLSAVYGKRDFGNEDYSFARNRILDVMASDIAAGSGINLPEEPEPSGFLLDPDLNETEGRRAFVALCSKPSQHSADLLADPIEGAYATAAHATLRTPREVIDPISRGRILPRKWPTRTLVALAASVCAVAVIGGSATLFLLRDSNSPTGVALKSAKLDDAVQSSQRSAPSKEAARAEPPSEQALTSVSAPLVPPPGSPGPVAALGDLSVTNQLTPAIAGLNGASVTNQLTPEETADLVKSARKLIAAGKIRDARLLLKRPAEAGDATAAFALGTTYDPKELEKLGVRDVDSDIAMARAWYQKAKDLASTASGGIPIPRRDPRRLGSGPGSR